MCQLEESIFNYRGVRFVAKWLNDLRNSGDPDLMPHYVASDLGLHLLPVGF